jgi:hypothetical protein
MRLVNAIPINLEFMGIQSPDIMADSADTKQMLFILNSKLDWLNPLYSSIHLALILDIRSQKN